MKKNLAPLYCFALICATLAAIALTVSVSAEDPESKYSNHLTWTAADGTLLGEGFFQQWQSETQLKTRLAFRATDQAVAVFVSQTDAAAGTMASWIYDPSSRNWLLFEERFPVQADSLKTFFHRAGELAEGVELEVSISSSAANTPVTFLAKTGDSGLGTVDAAARILAEQENRATTLESLGEGLLATLSHLQNLCSPNINLSACTSQATNLALVLAGEESLTRQNSDFGANPSVVENRRVVLRRGLAPQDPAEARLAAYFNVEGGLESIQRPPFRRFQ